MDDWVLRKYRKYVSENSKIDSMLRGFVLFYFILFFDKFT